jgi:octaprenyl-diphosphate synthase
VNTATGLRTTESDRLLQLYAPIAEELVAVEQILKRELRSDDPYVDELVRYGCLLGGKRLRPALVLLTARACGKVTRDHLLLAAVVEMIHTATLVHDDVLDKAHTRRHLATVNARWDNHASVLLGDYLFTHAFYLASTLDSTFACQVIGRATNLVCEGELRQKGSCGDFRLSENQYLEIISAKTAELCACSCELGAHYAGRSGPQAKRMACYGRSLGIAFQIADDLLDLLGDEEQTGKSLGTDLDQRIPTLPLIRLLDQIGSAERQLLLNSLQDSTPNLRADLLRMLREDGAIEYTLSVARRYAEEAKSQADELPEGPATEVLRMLPDFVIRRHS